MEDEWDDLDEIKHHVKLLRAKNKLAKEPTSSILEEEASPSSEVQVYKDYMDDWPEPE